jgi:4-hydroxybenzoate polyprenyltransferase
MSQSIRLYRLINILSIDVALGAVCCAAWFADYFDVQLRIYALVCLGLTVWIIYTADHLMDILKMKADAATERHRFHQKHFKFLISAMLIAGIIDLSLLFFIRAQVLHAGLVLSGIVIVYLLLNRWLNFLKEIVVAIVYCGGILLPAISLKPTALVLADGMLIAMFFLTALINLLMFSWYETESDKRDGYNSFSIKFGTEFTQKLLSVLFITQALLMLAQGFVFGNIWPALLLSAMNGMLYVLFKNPENLRKSEKFRLWGDAVFLLPGLFLVFGCF